MSGSEQETVQEYISAPSETVEVCKLQFSNNLLFNNLNAIFSAVCTGVRASLSITTSAVSTEIDAIQVLMTISKETVPN